LNESPYTNPSGPSESGLNPNYTFSRYVAHKNNSLAHAAAQAVAELPGSGYNPLLLYGGTGTGKTHLLHAIGHSAVESGLTVLYVPAETFTSTIENASEEAIATYRSVDLLLVDDLHHIAGKKPIEEAFLSIFNALYENKKQIVVSADRPLKLLPKLDKRLRACCGWGLMADIQPPALELRKIILRAKAEERQRDVPNEVIDLIALLVNTNTHKLEECLNRVLAYAGSHDVPPTVEVARLALQDELNEQYGAE
jgi:chromosomal replication initiator protein